MIIQKSNAIIPIFILVTVLTGLLTTSPLYANGPGDSGGLVPCGSDTNNNGVVDEAEQCDLCHIAELIKNVIDYAVRLAIVIAVLMFVIGGIYIFFGGANESMVKKGRLILRSAVIGLLIVLGSWVIINTVIHLLFENAESDPWYEFHCAIAPATSSLVHLEEGAGFSTPPFL